MADRKVYVDVTVRLIIRADDGVDITGVLENMDYNFTSQSDGANIEDTEIQDWGITSPSDGIEDMPTEIQDCDISDSK